jgi:putative ABC transport system permease protein
MENLLTNLIIWLKISIRNIFKNTRRSIITILAIAFGFAAINLFQGYVDNSYQGLRNAAIHGEGLGHLTIFKKGFLTDGKIYPEKYMFNKREVEELIDLIKQNQFVTLITPRLNISGLISNGKNSTIFIAQGLVPSDENILRSDIRKLNPIQGDWLDDSEPAGVVVSSELAAMLNLKLKDDAVVLSTTLDGMANALDIKVRGIFNTGSSSTNDKFLLFTYQHALDLYDINFPDRLVVLLKNQNETNTVRDELLKNLSTAGFDVEIKTWYELSEFYMQVKNILDLYFVFVSSIVLIISVMSIINTMSMSVMERTREIGTLRALGVKQRSVRFLFASEGALIGFLGSIVGIFIFFITYWIIVVTEPSYIPPASSLPTPLKISIIPLKIIGNLFFMIILSLFASFLPARRASNMQIVDALGHV